MRFAISAVRYDHDKTGLTRDCVLPQALALAAHPGVERCYVERHWLRGPRVRLCVRAGDPAVLDHARAAVVPAIEAYVADHRSRAALDEAAYLQRSETLGTRELIKPPYGPLAPDNAVVLEDHAPRADLLGGELAVDYYEDFLTRAMAPLAAHLEAARRDRNARLDYAVRIMTMLAASYHGGVVAGALSYRSHLEYFLHEDDRDGRIRARFAAHYAEAHDPIVGAVRATLADMTDGVYTGTEPVLRAWGELFAFGRARGLELAEARVITEDPGPLFRAVASEMSEQALRPWTAYEGRTWSEFHDTLLRGAVLPQRVNVEIFSAFRWMVNLYYTVLKLLDVAPIERYFLNHLLSEAIEEVTGTTWKQQLQRAFRSYGIGLE
jgi:lantibiotic biosynthesis dehydratase-like protein